MQRRFLQTIAVPFQRTTQLRVSSFHSASIIASSKSSKSSTRDTRLAGRLRFYKQVGVAPVAAPWEDKKKKDETALPSIESPISAGVDGSASASGVHHLKKKTSKSKDALQWMLSPRRPGSNTSVDCKWFGITLDGRSLSTPMGQTLAVPSERLAYAIAAEWDAQTKYLQPANMPFMTLACTTLDQAAHHPDFYRDQSLNFLPTDTTCFWADPTEDRVLHRRQEQAWQDLHHFVEKRFHHAPAYAMGATEGMLMARKRQGKPSTGLPHPPNLLEQAKEWVHSLDAWHLVALHSLCAQSKSFLVAFAVLEPDSPLQKDLKKAVEASRVEEEFQISSWGLVEGGHDYDRLNCSIQVHAAQLFAQTITLMDNHTK